VTWLIIGLGNPGDRYARTRHNLGAIAVQLLADRGGERFRKARFLPVEVAELRVDGERVLLARSHQFMNVSGPGYASLAKRNHILPVTILACHDEIDLPFGALKLKREGSTAGHHGLDSLAGALRSRDFLRLRLGVGRPPGRQDPAKFVLEPIPAREQEEVEILVEDAAEAALVLVREGLAAAQDRFNRSGPRE
jgi:PTH1 family peptidyl-tRNA hydrolase